MTRPLLLPSVRRRRERRRKMHHLHALVGVGGGLATTAPVDRIPPDRRLVANQTTEGVLYAVRRDSIDDDELGEGVMRAVRDAREGRRERRQRTMGDRTTL